MSFGLLSTGFSVKRLEDIKLELEAGLRTAFGDINVGSDAVFGQIIGVFSNSLADVWAQMENIYNAMYPATAEGVPLDGSASLVGVSRLQPTPTTAIVQMEGTESTVVPISTRFSQSVNLKVFETNNAETITKAKVHKIKVLVDTAAVQTYTITIDGTAVNFSAGGGHSKADIANGLFYAVNIHSIVSLIVEATYDTGDEFLTIIIRSISATSFFTSLVGTNLSLDEIWTPVPVTCEDNGSFPAPINSIDTIDTPVAGLNTVDNISDGTTGRDAETDTAFRIRRRQSLSVISASTLAAIQSRLVQDLIDVTAAFVFENRTDVTDASGKPPHSFEAVVAALDTAPINQLIADKIWELKPAGIETYGSTSVDVTDSNGDIQVVKFSHAVTKYCYVELTYDRTDSDSEFPLNGEALIQEEILRIGNALSFGADLLIQVFEGAGYIVSGVTNVTVRLAVKDSLGDPLVWQTVNITIELSELPAFDSTRVTIIDGTP
jgi:uncharacterized phage protein gp47/JayE